MYSHVYRHYKGRHDSNTEERGVYVTVLAAQCTLLYLALIYLAHSLHAIFSYVPATCTCTHALYTCIQLTIMLVHTNVPIH